MLRYILRGVLPLPGLGVPHPEVPAAIGVINLVVARLLVDLLSQPPGGFLRDVQFVVEVHIAVAVNRHPLTAEWRMKAPVQAPNA